MKARRLHFAGLIRAHYSGTTDVGRTDAERGRRCLNFIPHPSMINNGMLTRGSAGGSLVAGESLCNQQRRATSGARELCEPCAYIRAPPPRKPATSPAIGP